MTLNRKVVTDFMAQTQKHYHYTAVYTATIVTLMLILQIIQILKGA